MLYRQISSESASLGKKLIVIILLSSFLLILGLGWNAEIKSSDMQSDKVVTILLQDYNSYVPEAEKWNFYLTPISTFFFEVEVRFKEVKLESLGHTLLPLEEKNWVKANSLFGRIEHQELKDFISLRHRLLKGEEPKLNERDKELYTQTLGRIYREIEYLAKDKKLYEPIFLSLPAPKLDFGDYLLSFTFETRSPSNPKEVNTFEVHTIVSILSLPNRPGWFRGDFHLHSIYSDGTCNLVQIRDNILSGKGYNIVYMADHAGKNQSEYLHRSTCLCGNWITPPCSANSTWSCYNTNCQRVSTSSISFLPGGEISTNLDEHSLGYGMNTLTMYDLQHPAQTVINNINANAPSNPSSAGIAHPVLTGGNPYFWQSWTVTSYRGFELISGDSGHIAIDSPTHPRWRSELDRLISQSLNGGGFPSVRTGSDFHFPSLPYKQYYTYLLLPSNWTDLSWNQKKSWVDFSLHRGRTVASYRGSLGVFAINGQAIGSVLRGVSAGTNLNFTGALHATIGGDYHLYIFRGNLLEQVYYEKRNLTAGSSYEFSFSRTFTGGNQYYWLYVVGPPGVLEAQDYITSSPIFITSSP